MAARKAVLFIHLEDGLVRLSTGHSTVWSQELQSVEEIPFDLRASAGNADLSNRLFRSLETFLLRTGLKAPRVVVTVSRNLLVWRYFTVPPVPRENLDRLVGFEVEKHLPTSREEIYFRWLPVSQGEKGWTLLLAGTRKTFLRATEEALGMLGLEAEALVPDIWGLIILLRNRGQAVDNGPAALVFTGPGGVDVAVVANEMPVFHRFYRAPEGGEPSPSEGAEATRRAGETGGLVAGALEEARAELGLQEPIRQGFLFAGAPGGDLTASFLEAAPVEGWSVVAASDVPLLAGVSGTATPGRLLPEAGLLQSAATLPLAPFNLLSGTAAVRRTRPRYRLTAVLATLLVLSAGALGGSMHHERSRRLDELRGEIASLKGRVENVKALSDDLQKQETRLDDLGGVLTTRTRAVDILRELTEVIPDSAYLSNVVLRKGALELSGFADSASELISRLEASPSFKNVAFAAPITSQGQNKERFKIKLNLE